MFLSEDFDFNLANSEAAAERKIRKIIGRIIRRKIRKIIRRKVKGMIGRIIRKINSER